MNTFTSIDTQESIEKLFDTVKSLKLEINNIVEAGARDATDSIRFYERFPYSTITIFECNPDNITLCKKVINGTQIKLIEKALGDREGFIEFNILEEGGSSSIFPHNECSSKVIKVPITTLKQELNVSPDLMWLDAQGSELSILKGCGEMLKETKIIHTEVYFKPAYKGMPLYKDIKKYLHQNGFKLLKFTSVPYNFGNAIFINKKYSTLYNSKPVFMVEFEEFFVKKLMRKLKLIH